MVGSWVLSLWLRWLAEAFESLGIARGKWYGFDGAGLGCEWNGGLAGGTCANWFDDSVSWLEGALWGQGDVK